MARDYDAPEIMMDGEIMMRRSRQTAAMGHGMDAPQTGPYRAASVSPTKGQSVEDGTPGTAVSRDTRYKAASVNRISDRASYKLRQLPNIRRDPPRLVFCKQLGR